MKKKTKYPKNEQLMKKKNIKKNKIKQNTQKKKRFVIKTKKKRK